MLSNLFKLGPLQTDLPLVSERLMATIWSLLTHPADDGHAGAMFWTFLRTGLRGMWRSLW